MTTLKKIASSAAWWALTFLIASLVAVTAFFLSKRAFVAMKKQNAEVVPPAPAFDSRDVAAFEPVAGKVFETTSDVTVHAILSGGYGPAVVMIYAEWCVHCRNMMPAFEAAAARSSVPFVRIQGHSAPVTSQKHKVLGYPTVVGVTQQGSVLHFSDARTEDKLLDFAKTLSGTPIPAPIEAVIPAPAPETIQVQT
jgi:thiol-disulfide isomerase/thioredoxin